MNKTSRSVIVSFIVAAVWCVSSTRVNAQGTGQGCVALVLPSATGIDGDATAFANSLRDLFANYLTGPSLRAISLEARLPSQAIEEAQKKDCDYVLVTKVTRKRDGGNGWGKALGQAAGSAAYYGVPYAGSAAGAVTRGAVVAGAQAVSTLSATTRAKDELTLEFRLGTATTVLRAAAKTEKAKAKTDAEDLLTPLVEKASESIAATILRKQ